MKGLNLKVSKKTDTINFLLLICWELFSAIGFYRWEQATF